MTVFPMVSDNLVMSEVIMYASGILTLMSTAGTFHHIIPLNFWIFEFSRSDILENFVSNGTFVL